MSLYVVNYSCAVCGLIRFSFTGRYLTWNSFSGVVPDGWGSGFANIKYLLRFYSLLLCLWIRHTLTDIFGNRPFGLGFENRYIGVNHLHGTVLDSLASSSLPYLEYLLSGMIVVMASSEIRAMICSFFGLIVLSAQQGSKFEHVQRFITSVNTMD